MSEIAVGLLAVAIGFVGYSYLGYPLLLVALARAKRIPERRDRAPDSWPLVSITVPMYNEERQAAQLIESLLALEYPSERLQILIVSDASSDRTDEIVRRYADRGVELVRQRERAGKTAAENAAAELLTGEIVVNTDASIRIRPDALKHLLRVFSDPSVGVASGRDISVSKVGADVNAGESTYVGYEMWVRDLETEAGGIVGASGCLYAIRSGLHRAPLPDSLSRDFAAALTCEEQGYRAVSVPDAVCYVPRAPALRQEYRRKVRTITRGMETLLAKRGLLNPFDHGLFAWKLFSHKVCRWTAPWAALLGFVGTLLLAPSSAWAAIVTGAAILLTGLGALGWILGDGRSLPGILEIPGFVLVGNVAAMHAAVQVSTGQRNPLWEPTRREGRVRTG